MGDLRAQIAAVKTGERRFIEMIDKYGHEPMLGASSRSWTRARSARAPRVRDIPDGVYEAESFMDDDGVTSASASRSACGSRSPATR